MSWLTKLVETYEYAQNLIGINKEGTILLPIAHSTQNAQIGVVLNVEGEILRASRIEKEDSVTIIPVTVDSASRGNGNFPHPLCDKLIYIAGDYDQYVVGKKSFHEYYEKYMENLEQWAKSSYSNEKIEAIYRYLKKETLIQDLCVKGVLKQDKDGKVDAKEKIASVAQLDSFVRFTVEKLGVNDEYADVWKDPQMHQSFIKYYLASALSTDLCYASGMQTYCSDKHSAKVRHTGDKSKLISANDTSGFLYRGRFDKKEEANSVGYEASQKAHNALKWLIQKQGFSIGEMVFVAWGVQNPDIPSVMQDTQSIWDDEAWNEDMGEPFGAVEKETLSQIDTSKIYVRRLRRAVFSDEKNIDMEDEIVFMTLEAATIGRLSITFYAELKRSQFYANLLNWHATCSWKHSYKFIEKKPCPFVGAPSLRDIIRAAYGVEQDDNDMLVVKEKVEKITLQRLLPCVIEGKKIPFDIVLKLLVNASSPMRYSRFNREKILSIACAVTRKYYNDKSQEGEVWKMALQIDRPDRDYLYGRLLAMAQQAERLALKDKDKDKDRDTNAERYMSAFQKHPFTTWVVIYKRLQPYFRSLYNHGKDYKENITKLIDQFEPGDFENNHALSGTFLLGYSSQLNFKPKKEAEENENERTEQ